MDTSQKFAAYARLLRASPHNLMSPRGLAELESRHLPECEALARALPGDGSGPQGVLDVGAGGGLPGIVVAIRRPDLNVELLEAREKKVRFLRDVVAALELPIPVHHGRAEEVARGGLRASFDIVTARAVAPLSRLLGWTMPFLRPGGLLYAVKGERWQDEVDEARAELMRWSASIVSTPGDGTPGAIPVRLVIVRRDPAVRQYTEGHMLT